MSRTEQVQIKLSLEEKQKIQGRASEHGIYPSQLVRAVVLHASLTKDELAGLIDKDQLVRMEHAVGEAREGKPVTEFPAEAEKSRPAREGFEEEEWITQRTLQLKPRMSSRAARRQAEIEWEESQS